MAFFFFPEKCKETWAFGFWFQKHVTIKLFKAFVGFGVFLQQILIVLKIHHRSYTYNQPQTRFNEIHRCEQLG